MRARETQVACLLCGFLQEISLNEVNLVATFNLVYSSASCSTSIVYSSKARRLSGPQDDRLLCSAGCLAHNTWQGQISSTCQCVTTTCTVCIYVSSHKAFVFLHVLGNHNELSYWTTSKTSMNKKKSLKSIFLDVTH